MTRTGDSCPDGTLNNSIEGDCEDPTQPIARKQMGAPIDPMGGPSPCQGDPINSATGNEFESEVDYQGTDPFPLRFVRYYNSADGLWRHSYSTHLSIAADGIELIRDDGSAALFTLANGVASPEATELGQLDKVNGSWVYVSPEGLAQTFDSQGRLVKMQQRNGLTQTISYSVYGTTTTGTVTDARGRTLSFQEDSNYRPLSFSVHGLSANYSYNAPGGLTSAAFTWSGGSATRQYMYEDSSNIGLLTGLIDESGTRYSTWTYDSQGRAISSTHSNGIDQVTLTYNSDGSTTATNPLGHTVTYQYQVVQGIGHISAAQGAATANCPVSNSSYTYNGIGQVASSQDGLGTTTQYMNNPAGLLTQKVDASGTPIQRTTNFTWNTTLRVPLTRSVLDASGNPVSATQWAYNATGQTLARCDIDPTNSAAAGYSCSASGSAPSGVRRTTYTYCTAVDTVQCPLPGLLLTVTGPRTDLSSTATYSYYLAASAVNCGTPGAACYQPGDLHTVTDAAGHVTTIASYDADGRITRLTDANGVNTDLTYTPRGWLATRTVGGRQITFGYTPYGAVSSITDADGLTTTYTYDAAHRLIQIADAEGNAIHYTLDAAGDKTAEQVFDANGTLHKSLSRTFNTLGQLTGVVDGLNHSVFNASASNSYDANGNLVQSADALGVQRQLGYDALNRLVQTIDNYNGSDTATQNTTAHYAYDSLDRLTQVTDPSSLATIYSYDGLSDATGQVSPDTGITSRTFDAAGNVLTRTDAKGITATYGYDALNRLTSTSYPDSTQNITYTYDEANSITGCASSAPLGRLTRILETAVTTVYCYDPQGEVIQKQQITAAGTDTTTYSYTAAGRLSSIAYPSGTRVSYTRDGDGRIQAIAVTPPNGTASTVVSNVTYQPFGPVASYTLGNGQTVTRTYDANYRLTDLTSPAFTLHVARDAMGDITAIGNAPGASPATETYAYDPLYRLLSVTQANGNTLESVTYNPTGDRLSKTGSGLDTGTYSYNSGTHQLSAVGSNAFSVDADGNTTAMTQAGTTYGFGYSDRNRMAVAQVAGATVGSYTYNALNQRIQKVSGAATERYDYNEASQMLGEYGATNRDYIWMDGIPVANVDTPGSTSTIAYVTADQLGTPRAIADVDGNTTWQNPYQGNPWDEVAPASTGYTYNLRFPGQYFDAETGMSYNVHRDYDPATGRYLQSDPIGRRGGANTFTYVAGNPLSYRDQTGLYLTSVDAFCAQAMEFCAELWGDISHSEAVVQRKLGNACAAETADAVGDIFDTGATAAKFLPYVKIFASVGAAAASAPSWGEAWDAAKDEGMDQAGDWAEDQAKDNALGILGNSLVPGATFNEAVREQVDEDLAPFVATAELVKSSVVKNGAKGQGESKH
ncbi:RHS repeat protein [Dyella jejuensis]|uniref:RHS repeat protein n=1 Tax=Dyella jejuensis TaxID=1432009 RepID=A0ABW8JNC6_9GAMM